VVLASWVLACPANAAGTARIVKVLPHRVDRQGRVALSPSLYERDAYQAVLRKDTNLCDGLRFDVQWKAAEATTSALRLRLELLTTASTRAQPVVIEVPVRAPSGRSRWTQVPLRGESYRQAGDLIAWRATLWAGEAQVAEQKSFLW
jgi:hypothetical protein